jgi:hypothetical protein
MDLTKPHPRLTARAVLLARRGTAGPNAIAICIRPEMRATRAASLAMRQEKAGDE